MKSIDDVIENLNFERRHKIEKRTADLMKKINFNEHTYFYDDRNKFDYMYKLDKILYIDDNVCLCEVICTNKENPKEKFLIDLKTNNVVNSDYDSWRTTNDTAWVEKTLKKYQGQIDES